MDGVYLVTGASSGIGRAIASLLAKRGARVVAMARTASALEALAAEGGTVLAFPGDVAVEADCQAAVAAAVSHFGRLDGVIHSAGVSQRGLAAESGLAVFRRLIEVNYYSTVALALAALPALKATRGHFVVISSVMGLYAAPWRSGYAASKHAVQGFMDALRVEWAEDGVHVMTVCPGFVATNVSVNALGPDGQPTGQMDADTASGLAPEAVATAVLHGIERRARTVVPAGRLEKLGIWLSRFAPGLLDRVLAKRFRRGIAAV